MIFIFYSLSEYFYPSLSLSLSLSLFISLYISLCLLLLSFLFAFLVCLSFFLFYFLRSFLFVPLLPSFFCIFPFFLALLLPKGNKTRNIITGLSQNPSFLTFYFQVSFAFVSDLIIICLFWDIIDVVRKWTTKHMFWQVWGCIVVLCLSCAKLSFLGAHCWPKSCRCLQNTIHIGISALLQKQYTENMVLLLLFGPSLWLLSGPRVKSAQGDPDKNNNWNLRIQEDLIYYKNALKPRLYSGF